MKNQERHFEKHGISISKAIQDFQKLDSILRGLFGTKTDTVEKQIVAKIFLLEETKHRDKNWLLVEDPLMSKVILESVGDYDKKNILNTVFDESRIISDILNMSKLPQTSGYRKVNSLIQSGMLIPHGFLFMYDGNKLTKYKSVFDNITIRLENNKMIIRVLPTSEAMEKSTIMQLVGSKFTYRPMRYA